MTSPIPIRPQTCDSPIHNAPLGTPDPNDPDGIYIASCAHRFPYVLEQLAWGKTGAMQVWYRHGTDDTYDEVYTISPTQVRYGVVSQLWGMLHARMMQDDPPRPATIMGRDVGEQMAAMRAEDQRRARVLMGAVPAEALAALSDEGRAKLEAFAEMAAEAVRTGRYRCSGCGAEVPVEGAALDAERAAVWCVRCARERR